MTQRALLSGITGMDGSTLAELLLAEGFEVYGILRRHSLAESQDQRIAHLADRVTTFYGDLLDQSSLQHIYQQVQPTHVFNLAAQSHVRVGADVPCFTAQVNAMGAMAMLETCRQLAPEARYYQASSSEMMGLSVDADGFQRETTPLNPVSVYGCSKVFAYNLVRHYRRAYGMFAANGILFNHSGPRRGGHFVEQKICRTAVEILRGKDDKLVLGNLQASRDLGHSKDYTRAMLAILRHTEPDDFVIATGVTHTVREIVDYVFQKLDLDVDKYLQFDARYLRPEELPYLKGDATKARTILGWQPTYTFETLLDEMIEHWQQEIK